MTNKAVGWEVILEASGKRIGYNCVESTKETIVYVSKPGATDRQYIRADFVYLREPPYQVAL